MAKAMTKGSILKNARHNMKSVHISVLGN